MPPVELIRELGPAAAYTLMIVASCLAIAKVLAPKALDGLLARLRFREEEQARRGEHARDLEWQQVNEERQEEVALWAQMVRLQTQMLEQNRELLTWLTGNFQGELRRLADGVQGGMKDIREHLVSLARNQVKTAGEMQLMRMELTRVIDSYDRLSERVAELARDE